MAEFRVADFLAGIARIGRRREEVNFSVRRKSIVEENQGKSRNQPKRNRRGSVNEARSSELKKRKVHPNRRIVLFANFLHMLDDKKGITPLPRLSLPFFLNAWSCLKSNCATIIGVQPEFVTNPDTEELWVTTQTAISTARQLPWSQNCATMMEFWCSDNTEDVSLDQPLLNLPENQKRHTLQRRVQLISVDAFLEEALLQWLQELEREKANLDSLFKAADIRRKGYITLQDFIMIAWAAIGGLSGSVSAKKATKHERKSSVSSILSTFASVRHDNHPHFVPTGQLTAFQQTILVASELFRRTANANGELSLNNFISLVLPLRLHEAINRSWHGHSMVHESHSANTPSISSRPATGTQNPALSSVNSAIQAVSTNIHQVSSAIPNQEDLLSLWEISGPKVRTALRSIPSEGYMGVLGKELQSRLRHFELLLGVREANPITLHSLGKRKTKRNSKMKKSEAKKAEIKKTPEQAEILWYSYQLLLWCMEKVALQLAQKRVGGNYLFEDDREDSEESSEGETVSDDTISMHVIGLDKHNDTHRKLITKKNHPSHGHILTGLYEDPNTSQRLSDIMDEDESQYEQGYENDDKNDDENDENDYDDYDENDENDGYDENDYEDEMEHPEDAEVALAMSGGYIPIDK